MLSTIRNLSKTYGIHAVLDTLSFTIDSTERVGIVGPNGVGKSTLLRLLVGQEEADTGTILYGPGVDFGYLAQTTPDFYGHTIEDLILASVGDLKQLEEHMRFLEGTMATAPEEQLAALLAEYNTTMTKYQDRGGYDIDYKIDSVMAGLHVTYLPRTQQMETLSGGEKARIGLATLLLRSPDILLLDEPTNHLDFASMEWLENYISHYPGAVLMASHDRQFLNRTVNRIFEINEYSHRLTEYPGNYDAYIQAKEAERKKWEADYEHQQEEIKELRRRVKVTGRQIGHSNRSSRDNDKFARHFFEQNVQSAVSSNIRAAQVQLERIEANSIPKPPELLHVNSHFQTEPIQSQIVVRISHLTKHFGSRRLLEDLNMMISAQDRIILVGPNGAGKTTLLRLITGEEKPDAGEIQLAPGARIGYLAQEPEMLDLDKTVIETYRYGQVGYEGEFVGRLLGYGLFTIEDMHKKVGQLSIGQRRKLEIARLMAASPNMLLLDEPTNYISLDVLEAFEIAIATFEGPVLVISHDRWFIQRFKGERWELKDGRLVQNNPGDAEYLHSSWQDIS